MSSFRKFGGTTFAPRQNITKSTSLYSTQYQCIASNGLRNTKSLSLSHYDLLGNSVLNIGSVYFYDGSVMTSAGTLGSQGSVGDQGAKGVQGSQGYSGEAIMGPQGNKGAQGDDGYVGEQGDQGPQGNDNKGYQGSVGDQGAQGAQGSQGANSDSIPRVYNYDAYTNTSGTADRVTNPIIEYGKVSVNGDGNTGTITLNYISNILSVNVSVLTSSVVHVPEIMVRDIGTNTFSAKLKNFTSGDQIMYCAMGT